MSRATVDILKQQAVLKGMLGAAGLPSCFLIQGPNTVQPSAEYLIIALAYPCSATRFAIRSRSMIYAPFARWIDIALMALFARVNLRATALKFSARLV